MSKQTNNKPYYHNFKVRFHLGKGENFMHWRVEDLQNKSVEFYDPCQYELTMTGCQLYNQVKGAAKIHNRETDKTVVAWIQCESASIQRKDSWDALSVRVFYNPHVCPHWLIGDTIVDKKQFEVLHTAGSRVYKPMECEYV